MTHLPSKFCLLNPLVLNLCQQPWVVVGGHRYGIVMYKARACHRQNWNAPGSVDYMEGRGQIPFFPALHSFFESRPV